MDEKTMMQNNSSCTDALEYSFRRGVRMKHTFLRFERIPEGVRLSWRFVPDPIFQLDYSISILENSMAIPRSELTNWLHVINYVSAEALVLETALTGVSDERTFYKDLSDALSHVSIYEGQQVREFLGFSHPETFNLRGETLRNLELVDRSGAIEIPYDYGPGEYLVFYGFEQREDGAYWTYYCCENRMGERAVPHCDNCPIPGTWIKMGWDALIDRLPLFWWQQRAVPQFGRESLRRRKDIKEFLKL